MSLLGIRHVVLAVNKMDLVGYDQAVFDDIVRGYQALAAQLGIEQVTCIPLSALNGDNLSTRSAAMPWYSGPSLLEHLETVELSVQDSSGGLRMPVQYVSRPDQNFRGFAGTLVSGVAEVGAEIVVLPSGRRSRVQKVLVGDVETGAARAGQAVTLTLEDEIDISRGDVIAAADDPPQVADQFAAHVLLSLIHI